MSSVIRKIIYASVFILPFIIFPHTTYSMVFSKSLFLEGATLVLGALWIIGKLNSKEKQKESEKIPKNIVFFVFGLYALFLLVSGLNSLVPGLSFWGSLDHGTGVVFMLCLLTFSLITSSVFKTLDDWYKLFTVFVFSGIFFNLGTFLTMVGIHFSKIYNLNALSGFLIGNSSWAGVYLSFVFFIGLGLMLASNVKSQRIIGFLALVTAFLNPSLTGFIPQASDASFRFIGLAQTASYSLIASFGLFVLYIFFRKINSIKWRKVFIGSFLSLSIISLVLVSTLGWGHIRQFVAEKAGPNRFVFWEISISALKERPILGWGGDSYQYAYAKYFDPIVLTPGYAPEYWVDRAHNIYFDELVSGGITGFLLLMFLYGILLFGFIRNAVRFKEKEGLLYMALFSGVVGFLIQGLMIFQINMGWFVIAILLAFAARFCFEDKNIISADAEKNNRKKNRDEDHTFRNLFAVVVVIIFGFLFNYLIIKPYRVDNGLARFPVMRYEARMQFYNEIDKAYVGNTTDLGNAFTRYHIRLRKILEKGLKEKEKKLMIEEIKEINRILENSLQKQEYRELKTLMATTGFYSVIIALTDGEERQGYYDQSLFYVEYIA
ncbi:MAG: O-antigen ligase family protein [Patescibacteria group bacterium]